MISSAHTNHEFFVDTFRARARTDRYRRALVSATADYSMLAYLRHAYAAERASLEATVIDLCETPLFLNRWYAGRYRFPLQTARRRIQDYERPHQFDLVCTHNFLGRFDASSRRHIVARWHSLLRPGGIVITTQRVQPNVSFDRNAHTEESARALSQRAVLALAAYRGRLPVDAEELADTVYRCAMHQRPFVIRSTRELIGLFEAEGFELELADEGGGALERARDRPAFPLDNLAYRARVIARKR